MHLVNMDIHQLSCDINRLRYLHLACHLLSVHRSGADIGRHPPQRLQDGVDQPRTLGPIRDSKGGISRGISESMLAMDVATVISNLIYGKNPSLSQTS